MRVQFKYEETDPKEILIIFKNESEDISLSEDRENFLKLVVGPVLKSLEIIDSEDKHDIDLSEEDRIKISCPRSDAESVLKKIYRTFYTLARYLEGNILDEGLSDEERDEIAKKVAEEVNKMSDEEIQEALGLTIDNEEDEKNDEK